MIEKRKVLGEGHQRRRNQWCDVGVKKASELSGCSSISSCSEINVIQEDVRRHQTSVCSAAHHPHSRKIFSLEQVQRKATGWSEGQRVSLGQEYVYLSVTEVTAERYLRWFENRWGTIFYLNYFALTFMLVQLPKVIKTRCDVPAGWIL